MSEATLVQRVWKKVRARYGRYRLRQLHHNMGSSHLSMVPRIPTQRTHYFELVQAASPETPLAYCIGGCGEVVKRDNVFCKRCVRDFEPVG